MYAWTTGEPIYTKAPGEPPPLAHLADLQGLGVELVKSTNWEEPELYGLPAWTARLSLKNRRFLANGAQEGERNTLFYACARDMAGCGIDYNDAEILLRAAGWKCAPVYPSDEIIARLEAAYERTDNEPHRDYRKSKTSTGPKPWQLALEWAQARRWTGRTAQTDRAVFMACCERARLDNAVPFRASTREIAELANAKRRTAQAALQRLSGRDKPGKTPIALHLANLDPHSRANCYTFSELCTLENVILPLNKGSTIYPYSNNGYLIEGPKHNLPKTPAEQDVFGRLGLVAWRVWVHLLKAGGERSKAAIARAIEANASSVTYAVRRLQANELVTFSQAEGRFIGEPKTEGELETLAAMLDTPAMPVFGRSAKRKRTHQADRGKLINRLLATKRARWRRDYLAWNNARMGAEAKAYREKRKQERTEAQESLAAND
jgi:hypothetical protein